MESDELFLGVDLSTQSLKTVLMDEGKNVLHESSLNFDADLPEFGTLGGVCRHPDGLTVTAPAAMWLKAIDIIFSRMASEKVPFSRVVAVSGAGQQHGTVYLKPGTEESLGKLDPSRTLHEQLSGCFAVEQSPVWMDSSTSMECRNLETTVGGPQALAEITGSRGYERFSGNQIARIYSRNRSAYDRSERILLVSSFATSVLAGKYTGIDSSDASGMNLMNIWSRQWDNRAMEACAPGLAAKLGQVCDPHIPAGTISKYFRDRYGFRADCIIIPFSGDNPCSLAGLGLQEDGDVAVSMGTSDTMFGVLSDPRPSASEGHIMVNPIDPNSYMAMICYANGSLTRESIRDRCAEKSWKVFDKYLSDTPPGNNGKLGFFFEVPEITPLIQKTGIYLFESDDKQVKHFTAQEEVRAVIEGQFLSMRLHALNIGIRPRRIMATGGGSSNMAILRVVSQVFGVPVYVGSAPNSAAYGSAYRAIHGYICARKNIFVSFSEALGKPEGFRKVMDADPLPVYEDMLRRYGRIEHTIA